MIIQEQKGILFPFVLLILLLVGVLATATISFVSDEMNFTRIDQSMMSATYAAEAGAKIGIDMVLGNKISNGSFLKQPLKSDGSEEYDLTITDKLASSNTIIINSTAKIPNGQKEVRVSIYTPCMSLNQTPGLLDLMDPETASFSGKPWRVSGTPPNQVGNPPDDEYYSQVLFNDKIGPTFKISYTATLGQKVNPNDSNTGYGIYYFASGTPDNMTAYVFQYDPGAIIRDKWGRSDGGAFFVKKVIASNPPNPNGPWANETRAFNLGFQDNSPGNIVRVSLNELEKIMTDPKTPGYNPNFKNLNQKHKITIEVDENGRHKIYCDDVKILDFVDNDTKHPIPTQNTGTGLRAWNAQVDFYNTPSEENNHDPPYKITWEKR